MAHCRALSGKRRRAADYGASGRRVRPRRVYLISLLLVALAGVLGQLAPTLSSLVVARVVLGIGTSGAYPSAMRIFRTQADRLGCEPPRVAMSFLSLAAQSTSAVGPLLGGVLTEVFGWQSIFTVNIPLAIVAAVLVLFWTPKDPPRSAPFADLIREIDLIGMVLFSALLFSLMIFLMNLTHPIWWALLAAAVLGAMFVAQAVRREQPFIDIRMLVRNGPLAITYLRTSLLMMIVYCIIYGFAQWLESGAGFTSSQAGLMMIPVSVVAAVSSVAGARSKGIRAPIIVSIASALIGCICLLGIDGETSVWIIAAAAMLFGLPQGMFSTATQAAVYIQAPAEDIGAAAGLQRTAQYIGAIAATSILGFLYGQHATDDGFHSVATVMGLLSAVLLFGTILDRTLPRGRVGAERQPQ
ncbi:MFS transporter [Agrobacterium vitis]|uniref:MFS transporter n=1 Tax=Agrobacterium vitis TaxID=373 RepID=A0A6L6VK96_AGRVI|nr:MFS transporter [Agrobacterium vitis]